MGPHQQAPRGAGIKEDDVAFRATQLSPEETLALWIEFKQDQSR